MPALYIQLIPSLWSNVLRAKDATSWAYSTSVPRSEVDETKTSATLIGLDFTPFDEKLGRSIKKVV